MSEPLLNVMKVMLLAGLYLFFVRVLLSVFNELRDPRTVARGHRSSSSSGETAAAAPTPTLRSTPPNVGRGVAEPIRASRPPSTPGAGGPRIATLPVVEAASQHTGRLVVTQPAERAGVTYALGDEITIGRAPTNGIPLDDTYVSTVHARIFKTNGQYFIEDLASRNGTLLNGQTMHATTVLAAGDHLTFGATTLEFG